MATIVKWYAAEGTEIIFVGFTGFHIIFQGFYSMVVDDVPGEMFSTSDRVIPDLRYKPDHISDHISLVGV